MSNGPKTISEWAQAVYWLAKEKGWHTKPTEPADLAKFFMNLHSEISEAWEAYRKGNINNPCDKAANMSEPLTCLEEELADIVIRAMDTAVAFNIDIERAVRIKHAYNSTRSHRHGGKLA